MVLMEILSPHFKTLKSTARYIFNVLLGGRTWSSICPSTNFMVTKEKSRWAIPKVVAVAHGSFSLQSLSCSSNWVSQT